MAATDAKPFVQKSVATRLTGPVFDADGDLVTGGTTTVTISKDGAAFGNPNAGATNATEIATASGVWFVDLDATDTACDTLAVKLSNNGAGAKPTVLVVYPQEVDDIRVAVTHWVATAVATPSVNGVPEVDVTHFNGTAGTFAAGRPEVNTSHVAGTAQTAGDIIARLPAALTAGGNIKADALAINGNTTSAAVLA